MNGSVIIDCFPESAERYRNDHAVVAIDVFRATTTAVTAVNLGWRCYPVPSLEAVVPMAARLENPILVGELGGNMPYGFDMTNSPFQIAQSVQKLSRPMILLSSSGTQLIHEARCAPALYIGSLRNFRATARWMAGRHDRIALLGAGTRAEFRDEDQLCCAWIAEALVGLGYRPANQRTQALIHAWSGKPADACANGHSAAYLRRTGQVADLDFVLEHVDDINRAFVCRNGEIVPASEDGGA